MDKELKISVSGIRGIYPFPLSPEIVYKWALCYGSYIKHKKIFIGRDTRLSGIVLKNIVISALLAKNKNIIDLDIVPTPLIGFAIEKNKNSGGIIITASHNPVQYNGVKFFSSKGTFLNEKEIYRLKKIFENEKFEISNKPGNLFFCPEIKEKYFEEILKNVDINIFKNSKFNVIVDVCQGVGAFYTKEFLQRLYCKALIINEKPYGIFKHDPEPKKETLKELSKNVKKLKSDIGFAQDPDGDRLAIVDEKGNMIGEELVLAISVKNILEKVKTPIVVNLSTSMIIDYLAKIYKVNIYRTKIGEVNVVEKMKKVKSLIGGEGNGGVIFPSVHYGRDSFVGMALILEYMGRKGKKISEIVSEFPVYYLKKEKFEVNVEKIKVIMKKLKEKYKNEKIDLSDGIKIIRKDGWIHIRPSGTEPVLRLIIEGIDEKILNKYLEEFKSFIFQRG